MDRVAQSVLRLARGCTVRGSNPGEGEIFYTSPTGPGVHQASCTMGTGPFPGVKSGRGVTLIPQPLLVPWSRQREELYLYSPYGPYGLYRASVPVQGCTIHK